MHHASVLLLCSLVTLLPLDTGTALICGSGANSVSVPDNPAEDEDMVVYKQSMPAAAPPPKALLVAVDSVPTSSTDAENHHRGGGGGSFPLHPYRIEENTSHGLVAGKKIVLAPLMRWSGLFCGLSSNWGHKILGHSACSRWNTTCLQNCPNFTSRFCPNTLSVKM